MKHSKPRNRFNKGIVTEMAWSKAVKDGKTFTADQLAAACNMPTNRHFRAHLNYLASIKLLAIYRRLCEDGHYRKFYYCDFDALKARFSRHLPMFDYTEEKVS